MANAPLTARQYQTVLKKIGKPRGKQKYFLRAHVRSRNGISNTLKLQVAAGYKHRGGINLQYGLLARKIARKAGHVVPRGSAWLSALVEFMATDPNGVWKLRIYPEFARALMAEKWI